MSILTGKHILVIGEETPQLSKVEAALITYGADIATASCEAADPEQISHDHTGFIILNHLHEGRHCSDKLTVIRNTTATKAIPVLALVENKQADIAEVLLLGASDYFTPSEDVHNVVDKIKQVLGDTDDTNTQSVLDISISEPEQHDGTKVFVVEDDPLLQNLLATKFQKSGLKYQMASDGTDLVDKLAAFKPDVAILDLMLPGEDGFMLLAKIKHDKRTESLPTIIFSNKDSQEDRKKANELGANGFYVKAMTDLSELLDLIKKHTVN